MLINKICFVFICVAIIVTILWMAHDLLTNPDAWDTEQWDEECGDEDNL